MPGADRRTVIKGAAAAAATAQFSWARSRSASAAAGDETGLHADVIVVNQGANDAAFGAEEFRTVYRACMERLRAAAPHARILALRPFDGRHGDDFAAVVGELADRHVEFVDTTGWLSPDEGDFSGTVHPSVQGHRKVADRLTALIRSHSHCGALAHETHPQAAKSGCGHRCYRRRAAGRARHRALADLGTVTRRLPKPAITTTEGDASRDDHS